MISGACLCGAVRYEVGHPLEGRLTHCHCSMCRKHHGAPFASFIATEQHELHWLAGQASLGEFASSPQHVRRFCQTCGAVAPTEVEDRAWVPAGNLLGPLPVTQRLHRFVASKAPWHVIADDAPRYEAAEPGWPWQVATPARPTLDAATHGSCSCGAVTFTMQGRPARWMQCHCSRCRRGRSAAHGSNLFCSLPQFTWLSGQHLVRKYKVPEAERFMIAFCVQCGGGAPVERDSVPFVLVPAGLLDADPHSRPEAHIHVASRAPWYSPSDELPRFAELPPP